MSKMNTYGAFKGFWLFGLLQQEYYVVIAFQSLDKQTE